MGRPPTAVWVAWAMALAGGVAVLAATVLLMRVDLAGGCLPGSPCAAALSPLTGALAVGGTALALVGGAAAIAFAVRGSRRRGPHRAGHR